MKLVIVPAALAELEDTASFYSANGSPALGLAFVAEFENAIKAALAHPTIGAPFHKLARRVFLRRFPHAVIYQTTATELRVIAIMHERRRPGYWLSRK